MDMSELVRYGQQALAALDVMSLGKMLSSSGYFADVKDAAQAVVKVLAGQEMGIGPIAAMTGIYIVKGRVTLSANLMAAQIKRSGRYDYRVIRLDDTGCELAFFEQGQEIGRSSFTADDAKAAGLWNSSDPWKRSPRNMMFARAMSNGTKWYTPDVFSGPVYTPDELESMPLIEAAQPAAAVISAPRSTSPAPVSQPQPQLDDTYSVDGVVSNLARKSNAQGVEFTRFKIGSTDLLARSNAFPSIADLEDGDLAAVVYRPEKHKRTGIVSYVVQEIAWDKPSPDDHIGPGGASFESVDEILIPEEEPA